MNVTVRPRRSWFAWCLCLGYCVSAPLPAQDPALQAGVEQALEQAKQARAEKRFSAAAAHLKRAAQLAPAAYGRSSQEAVKALNDAGLGLRELGDLQSAEPCFEEALTILGGISLGQPKQDLWFAALHNNLGLTLYQLGRSGTAEPHLRRALGLRRSRLRKDDLLVAETENNLGLALAHLGLLPQAAQHLEEARRLRAQKDPQSLEAAESLSNLGTVYLNLHRPAAEVDQALLGALTIYSNKLGGGHPFTATVLHNLGYVAGARGDAAKAVEWYLKALAIRQKELPADHKDTGATHHGLGVAYLQLRKLKQAEAHLRQALAIREKSMGRNSPGLLMTWHALVVVHVQRQEWSQAADAADHARRIVRQHTSDVLPILSEAEQLAFLDGMSGRYTLFEALTLGYARRHDQPLVCQSAEWALNGKAVANECLCELTLLARDSPDPKVRTAVRDLRAARASLAAARLATGQEKLTDAQLRQLAQLERTEERLKKQLGEVLANGQQAADWCKLDDVRRELRAGSVLVEFVRVPLYDFDSKPGSRLWLPDRYLAWVIPPTGQGDIVLVDLGEAAVIDQTIDACRTAFTQLGTADGLRNLALKEKALAAEMDQRLAAVARRVLHPLLPHIGEADRRWTFCPDGKLWLAPWAALPLPDGACTVEKHQLNFLVSGRDLLPRPHRPAAFKLQPPVLIADPDYGAAGGAAGNARGLLGQILPARSLPGFKTEADQVGPLLAKYAGMVPRRLVRTDASEANFKAARNPSALMLCTHGFFFDQTDVRPPPDPLRPAQPSKAGARSNPLLRCGLLLAGCNQQGKGDDGILTGLEIIDTDLRGTRLVMLSACDTAIGDVRTGEGVVGLRQAFHLAGAQKVVATLWSIPDKETVQLSGQFFTNLADGQDEIAALRTAQLDVIEYRRKTFGAAHPYYWAAFMLTGK